MIEHSYDDNEAYNHHLICRPLLGAVQSQKFVSLLEQDEGTIFLWFRHKCHLGVQSIFQRCPLAAVGEARSPLADDNHHPLSREKETR